MALIRQADASQHLRTAVALDLGDLFRQGEQIKSAATSKAQQALGDAAKERARIMAGAADEGRALGLRQGRDEGLAKGQSEGRDAAIGEFKQRCERLEQALIDSLAAFERARGALILDARQDVIGLAAAIAGKVIKRAIGLDASIVQDQLAAVLGAISSPTRVRVRVSLDDEPILRAALPELVKRFASAEHTELCIDPSLPRGACIAASIGGGEIDASLDVQLERIVSTLLPDRVPARPGARNAEDAK